MKQVEMWKWFKLPVDCGVVDRFDGSDAIAVGGCELLSSHHAEKVEIAINSYDANQELIIKQAEQIKMLRRTLIDTLTVVQGSMSSTIANGVKVLEATKDLA